MSKDNIVTSKVLCHYEDKFSKLEKKKPSKSLFMVSKDTSDFWLRHTAVSGQAASPGCFFPWCSLVCGLCRVTACLGSRLRLSVLLYFSQLDLWLTPVSFSERLWSLGFTNRWLWLFISFKISSAPKPQSWSLDSFLINPIRRTAGLTQPVMTILAFHRRANAA